MGDGFEATAESLDASGSALLQVLSTLEPADPASWPHGVATYGFSSLATAMDEAQTSLATRVDDVQTVTVGCAIRLQDSARAYREADERVQALFRRVAALLTGAGG
ncbi:hypothetical protein KIN34_08430 [Cellulomonas sp. DKR-3]|uniref:ESX-1 secretion-associated protein n=1 Tax=Cellulomonas fulva TaxID=2835530 RepID=A0ABS5TYT3_9CELL|nr:hypothetical protein [Cellulomonas fulva]MBT0994309.1 hypothetical protein [Cellulomonas fulva]